MTDQDHNPEDSANLRRRAEALAREWKAQTPEDSETFSDDESRKTLHELRVHQIELEIQNEELRTAQVEIEASRARYFDLYDLAPSGYCSLSEKGLILEANLTVANLLGTARRAMITEPFSRFVFKEDQEIYYLHRKTILETGENQECELRLVKPDGSLTWVHLTGTAAQVEDGESVCRYAITNITKRKLTEEENEKLQTQLRQVQKMESVGRLAGGVAHDFNNMLGVILGYTELAMDRAESGGRLRSDLEEIQRAARHSADLTRQLLAFARKQTIMPEVLDLNTALESTLNMLRRLLGEDIVLTWRPNPDLWPVKMDPAQIDQMMVNLCVNARDAIADGGMITVQTRNTTLDEEDCAHQPGLTPGDYVTLTVSDDGCGMDSTTLLLVFDPFFTTKEMGRGTGLGLATVYGIVKQNSGFIKVDSEPDRGTTFEIHLPRHAAGTEPSKEPDPGQVVSGGRENVLLVEDEPAILRMTQIMLERQGYNVLATSSPNDAIRLARGDVGRIDLLITDVIMPEMSGRELADTIQAICPDMKMLFMSGYTADVIAHHGALNEGEHFIQKPFSLSDLATTLRQALKGSSCPVSSADDPD